MHEMLGHHHFMVGDYATALSHYRQVIQEGDANTEVKKRAVVCYVHTRRIAEAVLLFEELLKEDVDCIVRHNQDRYGCPCPEIIDEYECSLRTDEISQSDRIALGILWSFCDVHRSHEWFTEAIREDPGSAFLQSVLRILKDRIAVTPATSHYQSDKGATV